MHQTKEYAPGRIKIVKAIEKLLEKKDFNAITTSQIAQEAGVAEALIYKHFKDKRDLLHQVLTAHLSLFLSGMKGEVKKSIKSREKIRRIIRFHFETYNTNPTFARVLLLEVRNDPGYFQSSTYHLVRDYSGMLRSIIEEGIENGEFRDNVPPWVVMQMIIGGIEHLILPSIIFGYKADIEQLTEYFCGILSDGFLK
jgi:TetR/AcrR family fatty acid metabolism transcriptional regulator